jgi:hypothetical protein
MEISVNDLIATEVMGYVLEAHDYPCGGYDYWCKDGMRVCERSTWKPLEDLNQCALAEAEIGHRGLLRKYKHSLAMTSPVEPQGELFEIYLISLTAAERCAAMLSAIGAAR